MSDWEIVGDNAYVGIGITGVTLYRPSDNVGSWIGHLGPLENNSTALSDITLRREEGYISPVYSYNWATYGDVIYSDNFESGSDGDTIGSPWVEEIAHVHVSTEQAYSGTRSMKLVGGGTNPVVYIPLIHADGMSIQQQIYKPLASYSGKDVYIYHGDATHYIDILLNGWGDVKYYDTTGLKDTGADITPDAWQLLEINNIDWTAHTYDILLNGVLIKASAAMNAGDPTTADKLYYSGSIFAGYDSYIDDVIIRTAADKAGSIEIAPNKPIPIVPPLDISASDFCIEIDFKLNNLFEWMTYADGTPNFEIQYYGIVGQLDQDENGEIIEGGNYWSLYLRVNADYTTDVIFEVYENGVLKTQLVHRTEISWSDWSGITKTNSDDYLHIAVSRQEDEARLFINGTYSDVATSSGTLVDFTTINGSWLINGETGKADTYQPLSVTAVDNFRVFDWAYRWEDFVYADWDKGTGIKLYPRVGIRMMEGAPGTMRARLAI